jgi:hypothetical protein
VRTENVSYAANTSRAWGTDAGLHRVTVVAGTLTIERGDGRTPSYAPGMGYIAGWTPYVARNDTNEPVQVLVSYLRAQGEAGLLHGSTPLGHSPTRLPLLPHGT